MELLIKAIIGGIVIATVSTVSQRYPTIGAFVLGIPLATFVSFQIHSGVSSGLGITSITTRYGII